MEHGEALRRRCEERWTERGLDQSPAWPEFRFRLDREFQNLADLLWSLYHDRPDFALHLEELITQVFRAFERRPEALKARDRSFPPESGWFLSSDQVGAVCYVDRFAGTFRNLEKRIPYLKELGVTYLHLMPFFRAPDEESDGGYAVSSYRETDPSLGTMDDLEHLAQELSDEGIALVADFVFNHTSDEHAWARAAQAGDPEHQDFYWLFDRQEDTAPWQAHLRDIFPEVRKGSFLWRKDIKKWVWTTFHDFQWDLNYSNPAVFTAMAEEMLQLANRGVKILRLDAVAFVWKQRGTNCENLPQAHTIIRAFQAVTRLACPSLLFKSEAIVHPDDIARYIDLRECQISYNPLLMAELWEAAATKETRLLALSLAKRHALPRGTSWVNYVRCHDDIGWTFADEDAAELGIKGHDHRQFLNRFYTGDFPGSFARGVSFQHNPTTGDRRICGSAASLAGLEAEADGYDAETALRRLILLYTLVYTTGGIPLLYLGDEVAVLNRYEYRDDPAQAADSRWVHRPLWSDEQAGQRHDRSTPAGRMFEALVQLARLRREYPALGVQPLTVLPAGHPSLLAFEKASGDQRIVVAANFSEQSVDVPNTTVGTWLQGRTARDLLGGGLQPAKTFALEPCGVRVWLTSGGR